jgi:type II secretory pathway pseudopilin PulG
MAAKRGMTTREKAIVTLTGIVILGSVVYQAFLADFIEEYNTTVEAIATAEEDLADYRETHDEGRRWTPSTRSSGSRCSRGRARRAWAPPSRGTERHLWPNSFVAAAHARGDTGRHGLRVSGD